MKLFDLTGKVAVITGSTRGIGLSIAKSMVAAGSKVVISSRNQSACDEVAQGINVEYGESRAIAIAASISSKQALKELVDKTRASFGKIDILVCNAASNPYYGPMSGITDEQFRKVFENNVLSNHWLINMVAPEMQERKDGAIVVVSSMGGLIGTDVIGAYNITKAADFQLVRNMAVELGPHNIRVNAIAPGIIRTDFAKALWENPEIEASYKKSSPLERLGEPDDIAGAAVFLASRAGAYMTGQSIVLDGGAIVNFGR